MRTPALIAVAVASMLGAGCFVAPTQRREESLTKAAREFNDNLRWGRYEHVAPYLSTEESTALLARKADLGDDFAMADNETSQIKFLPGSDKATVVTEYTWYNQRRALVQKSTIEQSWQWTNSRWMVSDQRRIRGDRFPLVPEKLNREDVKVAKDAKDLQVP